jgi:nitrogen fixation protein FixH
VIALLGGQVLLTGVAVLIATSDRSFAVEPDYYQKALQWDELQAQRRQNAASGWHAALTIDPSATPSGARRVAVRVTDREGRPVEQARVRVASFHHACAAVRTETALVAEADGVYSAGVPLRRPGLWEFRITVERADRVFTAVEVRELKSGLPS